jgi:hypothetical protein
MAPTFNGSTCTTVPGTSLGIRTRDGIHLRPCFLQSSSEHHEKGRGATVTEDCVQGENRFPVGTLNVINREQHWLLLADGSEDLEEGSTTVRPVASDGE